MENEKVAKQIRKPSVVEAYALIVVMLIILGGGVAKLGLNIKVAMYICAGINLAFAVFACHIPVKDCESKIVEKITAMGGCFLILSGIGFLVGSFIVSGTLPLLVSILAKMISPRFIIVLSFVLCSILALCIGSSFAAMGTLGVVMFSVSALQGLPVGISAAAVISGCWIGQYISPVADMTNCTAAVNKMEVQDYMKAMLPHIGISTIITTIFFLVLGMKYGSADASSMAQVSEFVADVNANFNTNIIVILPLVLAIILAAMKVNTTVTLFLSGFVAVIIGIIFQGFDIIPALEATFSGFSTEVFFPEVQLTDALSNLCNRGGIASMADCYCFLFSALACVGTLDAIGVFDVIKSTLFSNTKSALGITIRAMIAMFVFGLCTADTYPPAIVGGDLLGGPYSDAGFSRKNAGLISMIIGSVLTTMVLPWSFCAWYSCNLYGTTIGQCFPYYILFWGTPIVTLVLAALGKGIIPKGADEE